MGLAVVVVVVGNKWEMGICFFSVEFCGMGKMVVAGMGMEVRKNGRGGG